MVKKLLSKMLEKYKSIYDEVKSLVKNKEDAIKFIENNKDVANNVFNLLKITLQHKNEENNFFGYYITENIIDKIKNKGKTYIMMVILLLSLGQNIFAGSLFETIGKVWVVSKAVKISLVGSEAILNSIESKDKTSDDQSKENEIIDQLNKQDDTTIQNKVVEVSPKNYLVVVYGSNKDFLNGNLEKKAINLAKDFANKNKIDYKSGKSKVVSQSIKSDINKIIVSIQLF